MTETSSELREWTIDELIEELRRMKRAGVHGDSRVGIGARAAFRGVGETGVLVRTWFMLVAAANGQVMILPEDIARDITAMRKDGHAN